jgi:hypothetical protein
MTPIQAGMTKLANIQARLVSAGDTNGMAMTKIKVSTTTEFDTRWISRPLIFSSSFSNAGDEKRKFIVTVSFLAKYSIP